MPGWDNIKTRAINSVNQAAQKADRMAQVAALRKQIQQTQQERQSAIVQLGATVYASYNDTEEWPAEWRTFCEQIRACDGRVNTLGQSIDQLVQGSNEATCPQCQNPIASPAKFCPHCGAALG